MRGVVASGCGRRGRAVLITGRLRSGGRLDGRRWPPSQGPAVALVVVLAWPAAGTGLIGACVVAGEIEIGQPPADGGGAAGHQWGAGGGAQALEGGELPGRAGPRRRFGGL